MRSGLYIKIFVLFLGIFITLNAEAKRKKKNKKKAKVEKVTETKKPVMVDSVKLVAKPSSTPPLVKQEENIKFAQLVVSFASRGAGIDAQARDQLLAHITWFNEQNHCELMYDKKGWGREGEMDFCFFGNNQILIPTLYKQLKEKFAGRPTVFVKENFPCK